MELTPQQTNFIETAQGSESIALRARAGTGKTFSLREWATKSRKGGMATSFSKSTVQELAKKMPPKFQSKTLHGLGYQAIRKSGKYKELDTSKVFNITKQYCQDLDLPYEIQDPIRKLVALAKSFGIQPDSAGPDGLTPDEYQTWENIAEQFDIELSDSIYESSRNTLHRSNQVALKDGVIDFDDMLYISLLYPHRFPKFPVILADEVQDFNSLQHLMLRRCLLPNGRIIGAGDDRQAIYAFRGALANSYNELVSSFSMTELPLTASFRCPRAVVLEAQRYVPDIEPVASAIEGSVIHAESIDLLDIPSTVLCRNNAPLITLALSLLVSGRTVEVAGQNIGKGLIQLTKRITKKNLKSAEFLDRLDKWKEREIIKFPRRKARITDKFLAIRALTLHHKDLEGVQKHLLKLYPNPSAKNYKPAEVHLTTIHRSKGKEWPKVMFLDPQLLPSKFAKQPFELLQEDNLAYVGITRAQEELTYCASTNINGMEVDEF